eukprot:jgi/Mesen1/6721/ME000344S06003
MANQGWAKALHLSGSVSLDELLPLLRPQISGNKAIRPLEEQFHRAGKVEGLGSDVGHDDRPNGDTFSIADRSLLVALSEDAEVMAVAMGDRLVIVPTRESSGAYAVPDDCYYGETITAVEWLAFPGLPPALPSSPPLKRRWHRRGGFACIAVGTSAGALLLYNQEGKLLLRRALHSGPVVQLRVRAQPASLSSSDLSEDLCAIFHSVVIRMDAHELWTHLRKHLADLEGRAP